MGRSSSKPTGILRRIWDQNVSQEAVHTVWVGVAHFWGQLAPWRYPRFAHCLGHLSGCNRNPQTPRSVPLCELLASGGSDHATLGLILCQQKGTEQSFCGPGNEPQRPEADQACSARWSWIWTTCVPTIHSQHAATIRAASAHHLQWVPLSLISSLPVLTMSHTHPWPGVRVHSPWATTFVCPKCWPLRPGTSKCCPMRHKGPSGLVLTAWSSPDTLFSITSLLLQLAS
jgi:hypothetical protein